LCQEWSLWGPIEAWFSFTHIYMETLLVVVVAVAAVAALLGSNSSRTAC
jgi:hypothetical protein